ncbi:hypothetical protein QR680_017096 [Steinernema hermaphroditum]|uniref:Uncharacterized protein n=1 Tax=Steinernema hermaphroditum TaxID=289476 RepID=A0AA39HFQ2_9BILA|nr:hypothetical protein QR680_017096 [Steinernema hermaphroditum]
MKQSGTQADNVAQASSTRPPTNPSFIIPNVERKPLLAKIAGGRITKPDRLPVRLQMRREAPLIAVPAGKREFKGVPKGARVLVIRKNPATVPKAPFSQAAPSLSSEPPKEESEPLLTPVAPTTFQEKEKPLSTGPKHEDHVEDFVDGGYASAEEEAKEGELRGFGREVPQQYVEEQEAGPLEGDGVEYYEARSQDGVPLEEDGEPGAYGIEEQEYPPQSQQWQQQSSPHQQHPHHPHQQQQVVYPQHHPNLMYPPQHPQMQLYPGQMMGVPYQQPPQMPSSPMGHPMSPHSPQQPFFMPQNSPQQFLVPVAPHEMVMITAQNEYHAMFEQEGRLLIWPEPLIWDGRQFLRRHPPLFAPEEMPPDQALVDVDVAVPQLA